jgi:hypothetical protein
MMATMQGLMHEVECLKHRLELTEAEREHERKTVVQMSKSPRPSNRTQPRSPSLSPSADCQQPNTKLLSSLGRVSISRIRRPQNTKLQRLPDSTLFKRPAALSRQRNPTPQGRRHSSLAIMCATVPSVPLAVLQRKIKQLPADRRQRGLSAFPCTYYTQPPLNKSRRWEKVSSGEQSGSRPVKSAKEKAKYARNEALRSWRESRPEEV